MRFQVTQLLRKLWSSNRRRFFEAAASVLLFGSLAQRGDLQRSAEHALNELQARGYVVSGEPIRIYPAQTDSASKFSGAHSGAWRPGIISLRAESEISEGAEVYLRHELFHEISHRSCHDRLPIWVEEAGAIAFSGELQSVHQNEAVDVAGLKRLIARDGALDTSAYRSLSALVSQYGWPNQPCQVAEEMAAQLGQPEEFGQLDYILINLASARVLEEHNYSERAAPPGSLLKILYAAALKDPEANLAAELARSDTQAMLKRQYSFSAERFTELFPGANVLVDHANRPFDATLLGERAENGEYPLELTLRQLAQLLRTAILVDSKRFVALKINGFIPETTLARTDSASLAALAGLNGWAKTGTASNSRGKPLVGHLLVVWPAHDPKYLAVFRAAGVRGAGVLARAREVLKTWRAAYTAERSTVRVAILSLLERADFSIKAQCPRFALGDHGADLSFTTCGEFVIKTNAFGAKPERLVRGILEESSSQLILTTDPESFADGVLASEAADLHGSARAALRAVIVWDGLHGGFRHQETNSLCDSTHCMVFKGDAVRGERTDPQLLDLLDSIASVDKSKWFHFSRGGSEVWSTKFTAMRLAQLLNERLVLSVQRERSRSGAVDFHLVYEEGEETVGCEVLRKALKLPSCPTSVEAKDGEWIFRGQGKGHGLGLDVEAARSAARQGASARDIIEQAFGSK